MITVLDVAQYFLHRTAQSDEPVTPGRLHKLAYLAEAYYLALEDQPLTGAEFQGWVNGPTSPELHQRYSQYGWDVITEEAAAPDLPADAIKHLDQVLEAYGGMPTWDLERLTSADEAWRKARSGLAPDAPGAAPISPDDMKAYYSEMLGLSSD
jgi:uncharacterized phage-associated protein